ncbi:MAG: YdeI/OmpD-associated family protein [Fulvivirga sp.]
MSQNLINKLKFKEEYTKLIVNRPREIHFNGVRFDSTIGHDNYQFILFFASNISDLAIHLPTFEKVAHEVCTFWVACPKNSGNLETNITRDSGWEILDEIGYRKVLQISLNENWSAIRIKPTKSVQSATNAQTQTFEATIQTNESNNGAWVNIPFDVKEVFGTSGQVKVKAHFDGHEYRGSIANMGTGSHILIVRKDIREAIGKQPGDNVKVEIKKDTDKRSFEMPSELQNLLGENKRLAEFYDSLSYTNRKEYAHWIGTAKRPETKEKRVQETKTRLSKGIKNPFAK